MKRKVCVCTGTRAEYGILKPLMLEIKKSRKLNLQVVASGMHMLKRFGNSVKEIEDDGFAVSAKLPIFIDRDTGTAMAKSIGKGAAAFAKCFERIRPDIVVLLGDRLETFAAAIAAACMNIPIAHIHGGDVAAGGLDEVFRYAISKFAHMHFAATQKSAARLRRMGEEQWRIKVVGAPGLDSIFAKKFLSKNEIYKKFALDSKKPIVLVLQHSITTEPEKAAAQMVETMEAIRQLRCQTVVVYPNSDAGGRAVIKVIERYKKLPFIKIFKTLSHESFLGLMNAASVIAGNSSSAIIEAPCFGLPAVNIGRRQQGRERSCNVIDVAHDRVEIKNAVKKTLYDRKFIAEAKKCKSPYGKGNAGKKIVKALEAISIDTKLLQKKMV